MRRIFSILFASSLLLTAGVAWSVDGVLEINQTCAVNTGCFPGDTAGFPVTITTSGSYRLTGNLDITGEPNPENVTAVRINAHDVAVDLNGFSIIGPGIAGLGGFGIDTLYSGIAVSNGTIRGMGDEAIVGATDLRVERMRLHDNGGGGIDALGQNCFIADNFVTGNGGTGIIAPSGVIVRNVLKSNGADGINAGGVVSNNVANYNGADGINGAGLVSNNVANFNGGYGIRSGTASTILGNTLKSNSLFGLSAHSNSGYAENVIDNNTGGTVTGSPDEIGTNICDGNTTCP